MPIVFVNKERLISFLEESPGGDYQSCLNPDSLIRLGDCFLEPGLAASRAGDRFQLERLGYFCVDPDSSPGNLILNRTVTLRDSWARIQRSMKRSSS